MGDASRHWQEQLDRWAIPPHITSVVAESPWSPPTTVLVRRADSSIADPGGESWRRAVEALPGLVLDVGSGAGAASLPLVGHATELVAVDTSRAMLFELLDRAKRLGLPARTIPGLWPDIADEVPVADVVVCHHVLYNVANLAAFATALASHARRRVVLELTPTHPMHPLNPLWTSLHGLDRPDGPLWTDALEVLRDLGLNPQAHLWPRPPRQPYASFGELLATTRRRLCLTPDRDPELAAALIDLGVDPDQPRDLGPVVDELVTIWWDIP